MRRFASPDCAQVNGLALALCLIFFGACEAPRAAGSHSLAEAADVDDRSPAYAGHLEPALPRPDAPAAVDDAPPDPTSPEARVDRSTREACPPEVPDECGSSFCCPAGLACTSGGSDVERYCTNHAFGEARDPCDASRDGQCREGLFCGAIQKHFGPSGPAICTNRCSDRRDCRDVGEGLCCVLGACHFVPDGDGGCSEALAAEAYGNSIGEVAR